MKDDASPMLICTVGGSPQPILTAIDAVNPVFIQFVCSGKDPGTGKSGSDVCILGAGNVCKSSNNAQIPDLPSIPTQANLSEDTYDVCIVPSDDFDEAFMAIHTKLMDLKTRYPGRPLVADYTGGTKTMTAALVTAVLETGDVELQLVTGNRSDLFKVKDGTQTAISANADMVRLNREMSPFIAAWDRFAYGEAYLGFASIKSPRDYNLKGKLFRCRDLSKAFDLWDRFDHTQALAFLDIYSGSGAKKLGSYLASLRILVDQDNEKRTPMQLFDLYRNAQRRATQGRYDDAMARCYRLIEWTAQWILGCFHGIDCGDLAEKDIPDGLTIIPAHDDKLKASLTNAWKIIKDRHEGPAREFILKNYNHLRNRIIDRNNSILGHGFTPIDVGIWNRMEAWMDSEFIPMLLLESRKVGIRKLVPQLPQTMPT